MRIVIAGCTGFIGSHLVSYFDRRGDELILLSRNPKDSRMHLWNPDQNQLDPTLLEGADVVINLCGENIFGRWTKNKMERIESSRLIAAQLLSNTIFTLKILPKLYIGASACGYYGDRKDEILDESSSPGSDFLAELCKKWESIHETITQKKIRVISARFGMVLGDGGALKQIEKAFRMGMGGVLGSGKQMMSWIAIDDLTQAIQHIIDHHDLSGPINFVAPQAISNRQFAETLGRLLNRPAAVPIPKFALSMIFGEGADIFLSSAHVKPVRLSASGYHFRYPELELALRKYLLVNV
jgi:uncharacterized protein